MNIGTALLIAGICIGVCLLLYALFTVYRYYGIRRVVYSRAFSKKAVFEGESVELIETVSNEGRLMLYRLDADAYINKNLLVMGYPADPDEQMQHFTSRFSLQPRMQIRRRHPLKCLKRGFYELDTAELFLIGSSPRLMIAKTELYVYPKPVPISEVPTPSGSPQGDYYAMRRLMEDPFLERNQGIQDGRPFFRHQF